MEPGEQRRGWHRGRTRFKPGPVRRLTESGNDGWVIPEFAWDPGGRRLLWTQNKYPDGVRVDRACIARQIRNEFVVRLAGVREILQVPLGIQNDIRDQAARLLQSPGAYPFQGRGCGGDLPRPNAFTQATV